MSASFGSNGLSKLSYNGDVLFDEAATPDGVFHLRDFTLSSSGKATQFDAGAVRHRSSWNAAARTLTLWFDWGAVAVRYSVAAGALRMEVAVSNTTSRQTLEGMNIFPLTLKFPRDPRGFDGGPQGRFGPNEPGVDVADYGDGAVAVAEEDSARPIYSGILSDNNTAATHRYLVWLATAPLAWMPTSWPILHDRIAPGSRAAYHLSLRFGPGGSTETSLAADALAAYAAAVPFSVEWPDRRPISMLILASSALNVHTPNNPRGWFNDRDVDVMTRWGQFRERLLDYAFQSIRIMRGMNAQGMITWDVEGEQYPDASYVGDPRLTAKLAPELAAAGLVDQYFAMFRKAGLRVGVTIRPQQIVFVNGVPHQRTIADPDVEARTLEDKIEFAREHWGCTIFYIDSTDATESPAILRRVHEKFPDVLLIPENADLGMYSAGAPFASLGKDWVATPAWVHAVYPRAFSVIDTSIEGTASKEADMVQGVKNGDILFFLGWSEPSELVRRVYREAGAWGVPASR